MVTLPTMEWLFVCMLLLAMLDRLLAMVSCSPSLLATISCPSFVAFSSHARMAARHLCSPQSVAYLGVVGRHGSALFGKTIACHNGGEEWWVWAMNLHTICRLRKSPLVVGTIDGSLYLWFGGWAIFKARGDLQRWR